MSQGKRRPWKDADNTALISLWDSVGSVALIAIMTKRSRSSVQTQASRLGLPPRAEESDRHRRRWAEGDDDKLDGLVLELTRPDRTIPIQALAERMGRSVDAVVARIEARHGEESDVMQRLVAPPMPVMPLPGVKPVLVNIGRSTEGSNGEVKGGRIRNCLRCRKSFYSQGNFNYVCVTCKRSDDWDFD